MTYTTEETRVYLIKQLEHLATITTNENREDVMQAMAAIYNQLAELSGNER